jgi:hypothetical protein
MRLATHQPSLFPWAGFWHKLVSVDVIGMLADVQFDASSNQHRCMLGNSWLTVPVDKEDRHELIQNVRLAEGFVPRNLMNTIRGRMPKKQYPYLEDRCHRLFSVLETMPTTTLCYLNCMLLAEVCDILNIWRTQVVAIPSKPYFGESKNARLWEHVNRIQEYPGTYVCGPGTASYIDLKDTHGWSVDIQREVDETLPDRFQSVLYFIGKYEDPLGAMMQRFTLEPLGGGDGSVLQAGHSSGGCPSGS